MRLLSIGNSFSQDAQRYLHAMAAEAGVELETVNLYIGGCPLSLHAAHLSDGEAAYECEKNGESTGRRVSLAEVLTGEAFDVVTLQQASHESLHAESYFPYLDTLAEAVRRLQPQAKLFVHETWAYADGSERLRDIVQCESHREMYDRLHACYLTAAAHIRADGILPVGTAIVRANEAGIPHLHRDGFHLSLGAGRYLASLVWLCTLTGTPKERVTFVPTDEPMDEPTRRALHACVD